MYALPLHLLPELFAVWSRSLGVLIPCKSDPAASVLPGLFGQSRELCLEYVNFPMPVPDCLLPGTLFTWERKSQGMQVSPCLEENPSQLFFGVRPCDVAGLARLDAFFSGEYADPQYLARRSAMSIVALNCTRAGEHCFCNAVGCGPFAGQGADLIATLDGDTLLLQAPQAKGRALLEPVKKLLHTLKPAQGAARIRKAYGKALTTFSRTVDLTDVGTALAALYQHDLWEQNARLCINCMGCTMVCPTCSCFQTVEIQDGKHAGQRMRLKDSCQVEGFTRNAGFHNPRSRAAAFRYRIMDKLAHVEARFGYTACVGCGRCIQTCPAGIDITEIGNTITRSWREAGSPAPIMAPPKRYEHPPPTKDSKLYAPRPAVITALREEGRDIRHYTLRYVDEAPGETVDCAGQFYMLTVFGAGEVALSIPFGDLPGTKMEFCVKTVGRVTSALAALAIGDVVGLRGPYGRGFPYDQLKGCDVLLVGSGVGMAPLRTIIVRMLAQRHEFGRIAIIASASSYGGIVYADELKSWANQPDVTVQYALAKPTQKVRAHVGYINDLLPGLPFDWANTRALLCASPRRIKLVAADLLGLGMNPEHISTSLETHMRCGIGKCGHCKVGSHYVCVDGPVFSYREMLALPPEY